MSILSSIVSGFAGAFSGCSRADKGCSRVKRQLPTAAQVSDVALPLLKSAAVGAAASGVTFVACSHFFPSLTTVQDGSIAFNVGLVVAGRAFQAAQTAPCETRSAILGRDLISKEIEAAKLLTITAGRFAANELRNTGASSEQIRAVINAAVEDDVFPLYSKALANNGSSCIKADSHKIRAAIKAGVRELYSEYGC